ncbi:hypothetical protein [Deinococcus terrestris]|uniref:hypothetical protein n=1 Tax=Deinococcus terrestris TaxID=2651870 RepID=UPI001D158779|nr:hypothetical protein [Deinococcus terrestris]
MTPDQAHPAQDTQAPARPHRRPRWLVAVAAGAAGAVTVTLLNEGVRRVLPHAPRMDVIGERALSGTLRAAGAEPPRGRDLYRATLAADLLSNALYYGLVALGQPGGHWQRGAALGLAAGVGAVVLPEPLGQGRQPGARAPRTPVLTATWYLAGGLAAAAVAGALTRES